MANKLDFISRENILDAINRIDQEGVSKDNEWSEYWIVYENGLYQFKYTVEIASQYTNTPIETTDFTSNDSSRNYIASLGFQILFRKRTAEYSQIKYWVGASYYGPPEEQVDMFDDFIKNKYWRTDHDLSKDEGLKLFKILSSVQVNDRICIRYLNRKKGNVDVAAMGTVADISKIDHGRLDVNWDYNPPKFNGAKPSGAGSGNWWKTLFQLKSYDDIGRIFSEIPIEKRVARLTWNFNGWVLPSGRFGKSEHPEKWPSES